MVRPLRKFNGQWFALYPSLLYVTTKVSREPSVSSVITVLYRSKSIA